MSVISAPIPSFEMEQVKADLERQVTFKPVIEGPERVRKHVEFAPYAARFEYPEDPHYAPPKDICGIRRKVFWAIIAFVILLNVGTIAGLVVVVNRSKEGELFSSSSKDGSEGDVGTSSNGDGGGIRVDVSAFKGLPLLPGTALAAVNWENDTRAYYQNGDGKVVQSYCGGGEPCSPAQNPIITDAKYFSSLESVGRVESNNSIHIFYLSQDNTLREKVLNRNSASPIDGPLSTFNTKVHSDSDISATFSNGEIKLYYQDATSLHIQELICTPTAGWTNGSRLLPAAPGSSIAAAAWNNDLRVYFINSSSLLVQQKWSSSGGWSEGTTTDRELDPKSALAALPPKDPLANPVMRMYATNAYNELFTFTEKDPLGRKSVMGNVRDMEDNIAAVQSVDGVVSIWFVERGGNLMRKMGDGEVDMRGGNVRVLAKDQDPGW
ncbi:hypothetical protein L873DRAFT_1786331 [Choiromyces venosus 120613-1]|uniref:Uncharacterized protein n=1 Tax=Choiromyces venosus 120613-1 TaxID=1336337 RepID=A0A3N4K7W8_9PEZI|nr:hypothetical protein L873DRAFT_1786331 [Choiromyces venosus 120613-1]